MKKHGTKSPKNTSAMAQTQTTKALFFHTVVSNRTPTNSLRGFSGLADSSVFSLVTSFTSDAFSNGTKESPHRKTNTEVLARQRSANPQPYLAIKRLTVDVIIIVPRPEPAIPMPVASDKWRLKYFVMMMTEDV